MLPKNKIESWLTPLRFFEYRDNKKDRDHEYWLYLCKCSKEKVILKRSVDRNQTISCGCYHKLHAVGSKRCLPKGEASFNSLYSRYRSRAILKNLEFSLTKDQFRKLVISNCIYCLAIPENIVKIIKHNGTFTYNGIDRVDNTKGYTIENCVTCCERCNRGKLEMSKEEFYTWIKQVYIEIIRKENEDKRP